MKVKKLFAGLLTLAMVLGMNVTAFASGTPSVGDGGPVGDTVTLVKTYKLENDYTIAPDATFEYKITPGIVENGPEGESTAPVINGGENYTVFFTGRDVTKAGITGNIEITLPEFPGVGIYYYTIEEVTGNIAGIVYDDQKDITMKVTVVNNSDYSGYDRYVALYEGDKKITDDDAFTNTYQAGSLTIAKDVEGLFGDTSKHFSFDITLTGEGTGYQETYTINGTTGNGSATTISVNGDKAATVGISEDDGAITINNLPYGVQYTITEHNYEGYTTTVGDETTSTATGEIAAANQTVTFVNTNTNESIDTGVYLDNLPYIIVFAGVLAAVAVLVIRRRRVDD